jgi:large subunit ribosomal protein L29
LKADEYRELGSTELGVKLDEAREEYFNLRFQNATGQLENFSQIGRVKRDIARIRTILHERELGIDTEVTESKSRARTRSRDEEDAAETKRTRSRKKVEESGAEDGE